MKKKYVAPTISFEYYELTQTIASCSTNIGFKNSNCVINDSNATDQMKDLAYAGWFISGACDDSAEGMDVYDSICYHTNVNAAFSS